ncbi:hypothetical protein F53441_6669 [Fusarium austroafricanum]|uniref:Zn(2)-C6 fungal-type domain-containing protein n=1 Tax=Fusarium austroafricanum TaxID=2364996 RepID=A0A8H4NZA0_9HYPO|nr:hypothetical protein F53441_6669 [Fusarium austroafricanum]
MPPANTFTACKACRRLKRKCSRDTPSCRLCVRLGKICEYGSSETSSSPGSNVTGLTSREPEHPAAGLDMHQADDFPCSYFLDFDFFQPILRDALTTQGSQFLINEQRRLVSTGVLDGLVSNYEKTIHEWLPMFSIKRLRDEGNALAQSSHGNIDLLVFLALEALMTQPMVTASDNNISPQNNPCYLKAKEYSFAAESRGCINIRLVQTIVLIALYEFGHHIYPAAYLTIGQAVRLATMVGLHSQKEAKQLFVEPETWTLCEEQRRTWWVTVMLDRVVVAGSPELLMAAPDPITSDLLPCNDEDWKTGRIGFNEALFTRNFHSPSFMGHFAKTCQAVHMLGKVLRHVQPRSRNADTAERTSEAIKLHTILELLEQSLASNQGGDNSLYSARSLCSLARLLLYNEYACNESNFSERLAAEVEMQQISLAGIQEIASKTIPHMARQIVLSSQQQSDGPKHSPVLVGCLYHAATECVWFIKENKDEDMVAGLQAIINALEVLKFEWSVCNKYLSYLEINSLEE